MKNVPAIVILLSGMGVGTVLAVVYILSLNYPGHDDALTYLNIAGHLDQFEGFLRLYFHPGREALRSSERSGLHRGESDRVVEFPAQADPAEGAAAERIVGRVVRLRVGGRDRHSVVRSYRHTDGRVTLRLEDPVVTADPELLRVILDGNPWVEARWFDSHGREWRDFAAVLRREPAARR